MEAWRARAAARHVRFAANKALYALPGEDTAAICRLAWEAVDLAAEATKADGLCPRHILLRVLRTTFAAEQLVRWIILDGIGYHFLT